jgi:hypothetical protein
LKIIDFTIIFDTNMIRYSPPKSRLWGHSCDRMSVVLLLTKTEQFLGDHTRLSSTDHQQQSLTLLWKDRGSGTIADTALIANSAIRAEPEKFERAEPDGATLHKLVWALELQEMWTSPRSVGAWG